MVFKTSVRYGDQSHSYQRKPRTCVIRPDNVTCNCTLSQPTRAFNTCLRATGDHTLYESAKVLSTLSISFDATRVQPDAIPPSIFYRFHPITWRNDLRASARHCARAPKFARVSRKRTARNKTNQPDRVAKRESPRQFQNDTRSDLVKTYHANPARNSEEFQKSRDHRLFHVAVTTWRATDVPVASRRIITIRDLG